MPEFVLDTSLAREQWESLTEFVRGYIEAAFFCGIDDGSESGEQSGEYGFHDLASSALAEIVADCRSFETENRAYLATLYDCEVPYFPACAGRDYWFTRNRHGVGYWDRGFTGAAEKAAEHLTAESHMNGESTMYLGDNGEIFVS